MKCSLSVRKKYFVFHFILWLSKISFIFSLWEIKKILLKKKGKECLTCRVENFFGIWNLGVYILGICLLSRAKILNAGQSWYCKTRSVRISGITNRWTNLYVYMYSYSYVYVWLLQVAQYVCILSKLNSWKAYIVLTSN